VNAILKYPGSKWTLAERIVREMPPHKFYLEPFFGSGAVFFNKDPAEYETINDLDGDVVNFFRVCREHPDELARAVNLTPFAREEFLSIQERAAGEDIQLTGDSVEDARRFLVRCCQGFGSKLADRVGWKNTKQPAGPNNAAIWSRIPFTIYEAAERLKNAQIENTDAVQLIRACNNPDCLIYADPPYLCETRKRKRIYRVEMLTTAAHIELLDALLAHEGPVILSGYDHQGLPRYVLGHTQSGDWINVSRDLLRLIIESASGGQLRGQLIYTERYL
jgi:DNA adenine methylase